MTKPVTDDLCRHQRRRRAADPGAGQCRRDGLVTGVAEPLVSADWCAVEFASASAIKQRNGRLRPRHAKAAHDAFEELVAGGLRLLPVSRKAFQRAADLSRPHRDGLRAGDALHLAVAMEAGAGALAGLDRTMNAAAQRLGLRLAIDDAVQMPR